MKKYVLSMIAALMLLATPNVALAAGGNDNQDGVRSNQYVNRFNDMTDTNANIHRNGLTGAGTNAFRTNNTGNNGVNGRLNTNNDWNNNMTTRTVDNGTLRTTAAGDNGTDWGWLGLLGLIGLAGMMGRGRDRNDVK